MRRELVSLLEACKRQPEDDAARLVLADWLEEHGDESDRVRAQHVRLEATSGPDRGRPLFAGLRLDRFPPASWSPFLADLGRSPVARHHNGLLSVQAAPNALVGRKAAAWRDREEWAWVGQVMASPTSKDSLGNLMDSPLLATVPELWLDRAKLDEDAMVLLARHPRLASIRALQIWNAKTRVGSLGPIAHSPNAAGLRSLVLQRTQLTAADHAALADRAAFPQLEHLHWPTGARRESAAAVAAADTPRRLRSLIVEPALKRAEAARLVGSPHLGGLRNLQVALKKGELDAERWLDAPFWPTLNCLKLEGYSLSPAEAAVLARAPAGALRIFQTGYRGPTGVVTALAGSPLWDSLTHLDLTRWLLGADAMAALTSMPNAPLSLCLAGCRIGDSGVAALARWPGMSRCRTLNLWSNGVTAAGAAALAESPYLGGLIGLHLAGNPLEHRGVERILTAGWVGGLEELILTDVGTNVALHPALPAAGSRMSRLKVLTISDQPLPDAARAALAHVPCID